MTRPCRDLVDLANLPNDQLVGSRDQAVGNSDQMVGVQEELRKQIKAIWPTKTAQHLSIAADITVRQAERILARDQGISLAVFYNLARSPKGFWFVEVLMRGATAQWWAERENERRIMEKKRLAKQLARELQELEREGGA